MPWIETVFVICASLLTSCRGGGKSPRISRGPSACCEQIAVEAGRGPGVEGGTGVCEVVGDLISFRRTLGVEAPAADAVATGTAFADTGETSPMLLLLLVKLASCL